jgi:hypothetical protein
MSSDSASFVITPETRVGEMLERFPELENVLLGLSPAFKALKNPVLRRTVAKVATLHQVSKVGDIAIGTLIERLRAAAGQISSCAAVNDSGNAAPRPEWVRPEAVGHTFDARELIQAGNHPMPQVMSDLARLAAGELYVLVTPFVPAPLIDLAAQKGFLAWSSREEPEMVRTYFRRS